ncbi:glycosyltransferase domain-containing protein [Haloarcula sp. AONF1]
MPSNSNDSNLVVYTAIFDDYDVLIDPVVIEPGVDYVCFTNNETLRSDVWEIRNVTPMTNPALSNRRIKILGHEYLEEYDISAYIDGNIQILEPIKPLVEDYLSTADFSLYKHPEQASVTEEAEACIKQNKAEEGPVRDQLKHYRDAGFPDDQDLSENRILFRRHHEPEVKELMWSWWREVSERVSRDQLSLMFVLWKHDFEYNLIPHSVRDAPQFAIHPHRPDGYLGLVWPYWMLIRGDPNPGFIKAIGFYFGRSLSILKNEGFFVLLSSIINKIKK